MADAIDSKSIEGNLMRVRLSPAAHYFLNFSEIFLTIHPENIPITAPAKTSDGQWTPTKTREIEIKELEIKNKIPSFLL